MRDLSTFFHPMFNQRPFLILKTMSKYRSTPSLFILSKHLYSIIFAALLLASSAIHAGTLTASVDRNRININETITFSLAYDEQVATTQLDFNSLKQDFEVLNIRPQNSSSVSIINGQTTRNISTTWLLTIAPRKEGTLVIPSFNINGDISNAIRIDVTDASVSSTQDQPILVSLNVDKNKAYAGEQLFVKVEIMAQSSVSNLSGEGLKLNDAEVELVDRQSFQRVENGISWQVEQLSYAVFPDKPGILAIPALLFSGLKADQNQRRNQYDPFAQQRGQRIAARSQAVAIEILPAPETNGTPWLTASAVEIQSSWSGDLSEIHVGEPITRTIEILAAGQRASVIPPLDTISSPLYKTYKDQPQIENKVSPDFGIVGVRSESEAIVPSIEGTIELAEQRISWWSTESNSWQEAILEAESFEVLPAIAGESFAPPDSANAFRLETAEDNAVLVNESNKWWQIATAILALVCLIQLWVILRRKTTQPKAVKTVKTEVTPSEKQAWRQLDNALKSEDSRKIKTAILQWTQLYFEHEKNLSLSSLPNKIAAKFVDYAHLEQLQFQLIELDASLYKGDSHIEIGQLRRCLEELKNQLNRTQKEQLSSDQLAPLYPS